MTKKRLCECGEKALRGMDRCSRCFVRGGRDGKNRLVPKEKVVE